MLTCAVFSPCRGQDASGEAEMAITVHERLSPSCELLQPAQLHDHGQYVSVSVSGMAEEVYSPEFTRDAFVAISANATGKLVKLLHASGFRTKANRNMVDTSPRVETNGSGPCPTAQEAVKAASEQLDQRRRVIQSKVYHPATDGIAPPIAITPPPPSLDLSTSGAVISSKTAKPRYEGDVILEFIVGVDGRVSNVKVVRSATKEVDKKATEATQGLKFEPARKNGMPVPAQINTFTHFRLY
jgi:TonB family protein